MFILQYLSLSNQAHVDLFVTLQRNRDDNSAAFVPGSHTKNMLSEALELNFSARPMFKKLHMATLHAHA